MSPPPNTPDAVARALRIARRRGQAADVDGFVRASASPPRRRELEREQARLLASAEERRRLADARAARAAQIVAQMERKP